MSEEQSCKTCKRDDCRHEAIRPIDSKTCNFYLKPEPQAEKVEVKSWEDEKGLVFLPSEKRTKIKQMLKNAGYGEGSWSAVQNYFEKPHYDAVHQVKSLIEAEKKMVAEEYQRIISFLYQHISSSSKLDFLNGQRELTDYIVGATNVLKEKYLKEKQDV